MHFLDTRAVSFIVFYYSFLSSVLTQFLWFCLHREVYLIGGLIHKSVGFTKQIWMHVCHGHHLPSSGTFLYECFALKWSKTTLHQPNKMWILGFFFYHLHAEVCPENGLCDFYFLESKLRATWGATESDSVISAGGIKTWMCVRNPGVRRKQMECRRKTWSEWDSLEGNTREGKCKRREGRRGTVCPGPDCHQAQGPVHTWFWSLTLWPVLPQPTLWE